MNKKSLKEIWSGHRRMAFGGETFAGLVGLTPFANGKDLTNSARSTFLNCRRRYQYTYVYGLAPRKPQIPFLVGGLFHDELDRMYSSGEFDPDEAKARIWKACEKASLTEGLTPDDSDKIWVQRAIAYGAANGYAAKYLGADLKAWEVVKAESALSAPMADGWTYRGKADLIVKDRETKKTLLVEHKTAGRLDAGYVAKLPLDNQILGYAWALREQGVRLNGVVYNVTKKPQIRLRQNETMDGFCKRIEDEYALNPGAYFYRETLTFSDADIDRFAAELSRFTRHVDSAHVAEEKEVGSGFYQNTTDCTKMGVCPFMRLCLEGVNKDTLMMYRVKERAHEELPEESD